MRAAREGLTIGGAPATPLVPRAIMQVVFIGAILAAGFGRAVRRPDAAERTTAAR
jgi:hypothetical protein